ncbi:cactin-like [Anoplophora glabripennis]|uniref:cactin-like n=1 Tax=Anoplophora glabripennis TaxID=217634 RepID=UPI000C75F8CF|nr:cactin-like [Anoplophora glabripennis]
MPKENRSNSHISSKYKSKSVSRRRRSSSESSEDYRKHRESTKNSRRSKSFEDKYRKHQKYIDNESDTSHKKSSKIKSTKGKHKKYKNKKESNSDDSSSSSESSSSDNSIKLLEKLKEERVKITESKKKQKELIKATETPEEKRLRRLMKKEAKERRRKERMGWDNEYLHYTNSDNPFGDGNLLSTFVWNKKLSKEGLTGVSPEELETRNRFKQEENKKELEKVIFYTFTTNFFETSKINLGKKEAT